MSKKEIFIILGIVMLGGVLLYLLLNDDKSNTNIPSNDNVENSNKDENNSCNSNDDSSCSDEGTNTENNEIVLSEEEIVNINNKIKDNYYIFADLLDFKTNDIELNKEYLTISKKIELAWILGGKDDSLIKKFNINENGEEETGYLAIKKSDFLDKYSELYGENISEQDVTKNYDLTLANDYYYGVYTTGYDNVEFLFKLTDYKLDNNNSYTITFDFLTKFTEKESNYGKYKDFDYDILTKYANANILEYPDDLVYSKMKINYIKNNDNYILKSIVFEK